MVDENKGISDTPVEIVSDEKQESINSPENNVVNYHTHNKLLGQHKDLKGKYEGLISEFSNLKNEIQSKQEQELEKSGKTEEQVEYYKNKLNESLGEIAKTKQERDFVLTEFDNSRREQAVTSRLSGKLAKPEYMQLLTPMLENVEINPETGDVDIETATLVANQFVEKFPHLIDRGSQGRIPNHAATVGLKTTDFRALPLKDMRKEMANAVRAAKQKMGV